MGRIKKKGEEGNAVKYITRSAAVKRLQVSLKAFRRLCILKGIYPREPPAQAARAHGRDKTYYLVKDIRFLAHDPLVGQLRIEKVHRRREARAKGRGESRKAVAALRKSRPRLSLEHVIRERFPTFTDAVRELDDVLCMVALFAEIAAAGKLQPSRIATCKRLLAEFEEYVASSGSLEKVFFSVKGIYYEARIVGERVRWHAPLTFAPRIPNDVDLRVMLSFLELYTTLLAFVNFRLYHLAGMHYPPKLDELRAAAPAQARLFSGLQMHFSREVPIGPLSFVARAHGAKVSEGEQNEANDDITHHISERPVLKRRFLSREYIIPQWMADSVNNGVLLPIDDYSPEKGSPPPHLSPFVDDEADGYVPERADQLRALVARLKRTEVPSGADEADTTKEVEQLGAEEAEAKLLRDAQEMDAKHAADLLAEQGIKKNKKEEKKVATPAKQQKGATATPSKTTKAQAQPMPSKKQAKNALPVVVEEEEGDDSDDKIVGGDAEESEEMDENPRAVKSNMNDADALRAIMLPKRQRRLYDRVQYSRAQKKEAGETLMRKRKALAGAK